MIRIRTNPDPDPQHCDEMSNLEIKLEKKLTRVCSLLTAGTVGAGWFAVASFCGGSPVLQFSLFTTVSC
jgi:hypothetical protein